MRILIVLEMFCLHWALVTARQGYVATLPAEAWLCPGHTVEGPAGPLPSMPSLLPTELHNTVQGWATDVVHTGGAYATGATEETLVL